MGDETRDDLIGTRINGDWRVATCDRDMIFEMTCPECNEHGTVEPDSRDRQGWTCKCGVFWEWVQFFRATRPD